MSSESVKVAVRVRPFNQREIERGAKLVIEMRGKSTIIKHPSDPSNEKTFSFDYSYWSHDGFTKDEDGVSVPDGIDSRYASQDTVFQDLGRGVLKNAVDGYNCSLFAYGQTGSGKSYSMVGYNPNKGIVPITCNELFKIIKEGEMSNIKKYAVVISMLEIYNERVRDLLSKEAPPKGGLKIRQSVKMGFEVEDLKKVPVRSYKDIDKWMNQGTANRTVAATQMNATSSRAHTVISIEFKQIITQNGSVNTRNSTINLIDLAGSERAASTGATGDRLKEGANINKSLSALGNVIAALADSSVGKKGAVIPYRDSVLTKLLKNALGGNSKTVMIAALSPADINYDETLSTLRYADRAKRIKNVAIVNENPLEKLIRELREENEKLRKIIEGEMPKDIDTRGMSEEDIKILREQIQKELVSEMQSKNDMLAICDGTSWDDKLTQAEDQFNEESEETNTSTVGMNTEVITNLKSGIHFTNINQDPILSHYLVYGLGEVTNQFDIGKKGTLVIDGPGINDSHALIRVQFNGASNGADGPYCVWVKPVKSNTSVVRVNGVQIFDEVQIFDGDRILLGSSNLYMFHNPFLPIKDIDKYQFDWEMSMNEIAKVEGLCSDNDDDDNRSLKAEIIEILPMIYEVNSIAGSMEKHRMFSVLIIPASAQDVLYGTKASPKLMIKMTNMINGNTWLWEKEQFINRRYIIQEIYERFCEDDDIDKLTNEEDPFWEPSTDVMVGLGYCFMQNLGYGVTFENEINILDYKGREEGILKLDIIPCFAETNQEAGDELFTEDENEWLNKPYAFKIKIKQAKLFKPRYIHGCRVVFRFFNEEELYETNTIYNTLEAKFNYEKVINISVVTKDILDYFMNHSLMFRVYGIQENTNQKPRMLNILERSESSLYFDLESSKLKSQDFICKKINDQLSRKINRLKQICIEWASKSQENQEFDGFYRSVAALAFSSGNKFKVVANIVGKASVVGKKLKSNENLDLIDNETENKPAKITIYRKNGTKDNLSEVCSMM